MRLTQAAPGAGGAGRDRKVANAAGDLIRQEHGGMRTDGPADRTPES